MPLGTLFPWLAHNDVHLTVPHGSNNTRRRLGTRDVCQGRLSSSLRWSMTTVRRSCASSSRNNTRRAALAAMVHARTLFDPEKVSHGDIIVWPLKALNDISGRPATSAFSTRRSHGGASCRLSKRRGTILSLRMWKAARHASALHPARIRGQGD